MSATSTSNCLRGACLQARRVVNIKRKHEGGGAYARLHRHLDAGLLAFDARLDALLVGGVHGVILVESGRETEMALESPNRGKSFYSN